MADIVIRGMEMPILKTELIVFPSGVVQVYDSHGSYLGKAQAVPLPEGHGRLVDADAIDTTWCDPEVDYVLSEAPTILEAEGGGEDG